MRQWNRFLRWWINPASTKIERKERISGNQQKKRQFAEGRPIPIEVAFLLFNDGSVLKRSRQASGERRVDSLDVKQVVYDEYDEILRLAVAKHRREVLMKRFFGRKVRQAEQ